MRHHRNGLLRSGVKPSETRLAPRRIGASPVGVWRAGRFVGVDGVDFGEVERGELCGERVQRAACVAGAIIVL